MGDLHVFCSKTKRPMFLNCIIYSLLCLIGLKVLSLFIPKDIVANSELELVLSIIFIGAVTICAIVLSISTIVLFIQFVFIKPFFYFDLKGQVYVVDGEYFYVIDFDNTPHNNTKTANLAYYSKLLSFVELELNSKHKSELALFRVIDFIKVTKYDRLTILESSDNRIVLQDDSVELTNGIARADIVIDGNIKDYSKLKSLLECTYKTI